MFAASGVKIIRNTISFRVCKSCICLIELLVLLLPYKNKLTSVLAACLRFGVAPLTDYAIGLRSAK